MSTRTIIVAILVFIISKSLAQNKDLFIRNKRPLPIDGSWSEWQSWSTCYKNNREHKNFFAPLENYILQSRNRSCTSPKPIHGGKDCKPPSHRFRQCTCMNPLGMSTKLIKDSQITSSPFLTDYPSNEGRLNESYKGWCAKYRATHTRKPYIQIDFNQFAKVGAIRTLGNEMGRTAFYKAEYSVNGIDWKKIKTDTGSYNLEGNVRRGKEKELNFSQHKIMRYLRVSPIKSYKYPCLKMEPLGCMFTCGNTLTESFGEILARSRIDIDQNCLWRIEVLNTTSLTFDFKIFDILCSHGYLDFRDGNTDFMNAPQLKRVCLSKRDEEPSLFTLNNNVVWLKFVSNSSDSEDGFSIHYFSSCNQSIQLVQGEPVVIKSPNYPKNYFGNLDCSWSIVAPSDVQAIDITIKDDFNVESVNKSLCSDDVVIIKYFKDNNKKFLGNFCNAKMPERNYQLDADKINIEFKTDRILSKKGFHITVVSGHKVNSNRGDVTSLYLTNSPSTAVNLNGTDNVPVKEKKKNKDGGSHWTVIIISAFSAFAFVLLAFVIGSNIRRYINNRNELNAQCAKVAAKNQENKNKKQPEMKTLFKQDPVVIISSGNFLVDNQNNIQTSEHHDDVVDEEHNQLISPASEKESEFDDHIEGSPMSLEGLDTPIKYNSSILHVHSPLKLCNGLNTGARNVNSENANINDIPNISTDDVNDDDIDVNNIDNCDVESCV